VVAIKTVNFDAGLKTEVKSLCYTEPIFDKLHE